MLGGRRAELFHRIASSVDVPPQVESKYDFLKCHPPSSASRGNHLFFHQIVMQKCKEILRFPSSFLLFSLFILFYFLKLFFFLLLCLGVFWYTDHLSGNHDISVDQEAVAQENSARSQSQPQFEVFPSEGIIPSSALPVLGVGKEERFSRWSNK